MKIPDVSLSMQEVFLNHNCVTLVTIAWPEMQLWAKAEGVDGCSII